jgi:hypothetical protein
MVGGEGKDEGKEGKWKVILREMPSVARNVWRQSKLGGNIIRRQN